MRSVNRVLLLGVLGLSACYEVTSLPQQMVPPPVMPPPPDRTPVINSFNVVTASILSGQTAELQYEVVDAEFVKIDMGTVNLLPASIALAGRVFTPPLFETSTVVLTATNKDKVVTTSRTITVTDVAPPKHAAIELFAPDPSNIDEGQNVTLNWITKDAAEGKIYANNVLLMTIAEPDLALGSFIVTPVETIIYTLSVKGTDQQEVSLTRLVQVVPVGTMNLTARELYDRTVDPILNQVCKSCHAGDGALEAQPLDGPNFMGPSQTAHYGAITSDSRLLAQPENSILLLKGLHSGPAFTTDQANKVSAWLLKEVEERMLNMMPPPMGGLPRTLQEGLTRFGACMTQADWDATVGQNDQTNYGRQNSAEGPCYGCHDVGAGGFIAKANSTQLFQAMKGPPGGPVPIAYLLKLITGTVDTQTGAFNGLMESYRVRDKSDDPGHPNYQLANARRQAITDFVTRTMAIYSDPLNTCAPPPP
jgi:hypothetical protein